MYVAFAFLLFPGWSLWLSSLNDKELPLWWYPTRSCIYNIILVFFHKTHFASDAKWHLRNFQAVLRALYAYFADRPLKEIPHIEVIHLQICIISIFYNNLSVWKFMILSFEIDFEYMKKGCFIHLNFVTLFCKWNATHLFFRNMQMPLHTIIEIQMGVTGVQEKRYKLMW